VLADRGLKGPLLLLLLLPPLLLERAAALASALAGGVPQGLVRPAELLLLSLRDAGQEMLLLSLLGRALCWAVLLAMEP
jgi:hypothetical protein